VAGIATWDAVKYRFIPKRFGVVVPGEIYRSGQISQYQFTPTIRTHGIDVVIDLNGVDPTDVDQAAEIAAYDALGIENHRFKLEGNGTGVVENYVNAIAMLAECHRAGKSVLVHCHAGTQRTGSVVAAYRVLVLGESPQAAFSELAQYGWDADSDQVLLLYLNGHMRHVAEELAARGVIGRVPDPIPVVGP
jgi:protein tyrosine/serine phosphatase